MKTVNYRVRVTQGILVSPGFSYSRYLRYLNPHLGQDSVLRGEGSVHQAPGPGPLQSPEPVDPALGPRIILDPLVTGVDLGLQLRPVTLPMGRRDADPALEPGISRSSRHRRRSVSSNRPPLRHSYQDEAWRQLYLGLLRGGGIRGRERAWKD